MPQLDRNVEVLKAYFEPKRKRGRPPKERPKTMTYPSFRELREVGQEVGIPCPKGAIFLAFHPFQDGAFAIWLSGEKDAIEEARTFLVSENDTPVNVSPKTLRHLASAPRSESAMFHLWEVLP